MSTSGRCHSWSQSDQWQCWEVFSTPPGYQTHTKFQYSVRCVKHIPNDLRKQSSKHRKNVKWEWSAQPLTLAFITRYPRATQALPSMHCDSESLFFSDSLFRRAEKKRSAIKKTDVPPRLRQGKRNHDIWKKNFIIFLPEHRLTFVLEGVNYILSIKH